MCKERLGFRVFLMFSVVRDRSYVCESGCAYEQNRFNDYQKLFHLPGDAEYVVIHISSSNFRRWFGIIICGSSLGARRSYDATWYSPGRRPQSEKG